jgi:hypothetical protein
LFTGKYPKDLYDVIVGMNRWVYRVIAYVVLLTDDYPPFRLDQGPDEPTDPPVAGPPALPHDATDSDKSDTRQLAHF